MDEKIKSDFCIEIDFARGTGDPKRIFKTMQDLIGVFTETDKTLVRSIDPSIEPVLILEDIESGSLKTFFTEFLRQFDDDALKNLDWKPQVGQYLVKAKYLMINFIEGKSTITDRDEIVGLQDEIFELAEETEANRFPAYSKPEQKELLSNLHNLSKALDSLENTDNAKFISPDGEASFNMEFNFSPESIEELLTKEEITNEVTTILKVKKPDYLGNSMWDFKYDGKSISAKISHPEWLGKFQDREIDIRPGDSIKAELKITAKYGFENDHIATKYEVIEVLNIEHANGENIDLFR